MARKISKKGLIKKLQALMREIVILRDGGCVTCPIWQELLENGWHGTNVLQAGHYYSRSKKSIKYDLRNVHCQCTACNSRHRQHEDAFTLYLTRKFGEEWMEQLTKDKYKLAPQIENMGSLRMIEEQLETILKEMQTNTLES